MSRNQIKGHGCYSLSSRQVFLGEIDFQKHNLKIKQKTYSDLIATEND